MTRVTYLAFVCALATGQASAQGVLFSETFDTTVTNSGITVNENNFADAGYTQFTVFDGNLQQGDRFEIRGYSDPRIGGTNNGFYGQDTVGTNPVGSSPGAFLTTVEIDISSATQGVFVSLFAIGDTSAEDNDFLNVFATVDGGAEQLLIQRNGNDDQLPTSGVLLESGALFGDSLVVRVEIINDSTLETFVFDDLQVIAIPAPGAISALAVAGLVSVRRRRM